MSNRTLRVTGLAGLIGMVLLGLLALQWPSNADDTKFKRDEQNTGLVLTEDEDLDDDPDDPLTNDPLTQVSVVTQVNPQPQRVDVTRDVTRDVASRQVSRVSRNVSRNTRPSRHVSRVSRDISRDVSRDVSRPSRNTRDHT